VPGISPALGAMLEARSVALVGASPRPGSLGGRMISEVARSHPAPRTYLVNPRYQEIAGMPCHPSLADLPEPVDLALLAVPDAALEEQLALAAARGDRSAVIFGSAFDPPGQPPGQHPGLRARLAAIASDAGMAVCGAGCMGFINAARGLRAVGYIEPDPLPRGPVALVTHSGSVFSALLRTRRALGFTLAVSSGQELVTGAGQYAGYALSMEGTRVLALVLEALREPGRMRAVLAAAAARDIPVVLLTAGSTARGRAMVAAHSGALAAADGGWEALARAYGVHRVRDLAEMTDTLELFAAGRRAPRLVAAPGSGPASRPPAADPAQTGPRSHAGIDVHPGTVGIATVHDSGLERAHVADVADELGVPFAAIGEETLGRLSGLLDPGLEPGNPLDVWGTGAAAQDQLAGALAALAADPAVAAVALAVDLITEFDGDDSYPLAVLDAARGTGKPVAVLSSVPAAIDPGTAARLRAAGVPVLEGTRSGLLALRHLLDHAGRPVAADGGPPAAADGGRPVADGRPPAADGRPPAADGGPPAADPARRERWAEVIMAGAAHGATLFRLLADYGIRCAQARAARSVDEALAAAAAIGYPVVLKTDEPGIGHKSDAGGVLLGIRDPVGLRSGYARLAAQLGPRVLVCETIPPGVELSAGLARDPGLGPLLVIGAGGVLVELLADRVVALPPVSPGQAVHLLAGLRAARLLGGVRGQPPADYGAVAAAIASVSQLAVELGDVLEALDINPLICGPGGAVAVDALAVPAAGRHPPPPTGARPPLAGALGAADA
jgi:acyl-CoA synthetase (NDP forming)